MANYNNANYVADAIESVLRQTYQDWELIVLDDASSDVSYKIIDQYLKDSRIKFFQNDNNLGYIKSLKKMIRLSKAPILGILDSDDALEKSTLEKVMWAYDSSKCGVVYTKLIHCNDRLLAVGKEFGKIMPEKKSNLHFPYTGAFRTFKKEAYFRTTGFDETMEYAEDRDIIFKLEEVTKFYCIDEPLYLYRRSVNTHTTHPLKSNIGKINLAKAKHNAFLRRKGTDVPNLTKCQMSSVFWYALPACIKLLDKEKFKEYFFMAMKLCPFNVWGFLVFVGRIIKFPFYRFMRFLKSDTEKYV